MKHDDDLEMNRQLTPDEYALAMKWAIDITYEPNKKKENQ